MFLQQTMLFDKQRKQSRTIHLFIYKLFILPKLKNIQKID